jgi:cytosine permease
MLPAYIEKTTPNPASNRAPWFVNTAPSYAGVFLWIAFYQTLAQGTIDRASLGLCLLALALAGALSYALFYYVPGMLGMKTGLPLYVVGSSTFGTAGGYLMPGLLMGLLQLGWFAVGTFYSTKFILSAVGSAAGPGSMEFAIVAVLWGYIMAYIGVKGIQYVAKASLFLNLKNFSGMALHKPAIDDSMGAFLTILQTVIGFFATAGAAGVDFGMNSRNENDVKMGGLTGIALAIVIAGGLPILSVAGARALDPTITSYSYDAVIGAQGGFLASAMFILFAVASITPACFCAFIAGNSFSTMIPGVPRMSSTMAGVTVAILLAITGAAANLAAVFSIVGASFGPICGAMVADYFLSGKEWSGPRQGINWAGYGAWAAGFAVGIQTGYQPAVVYSFFVGLVVYAVLAKAGLQPAVVAPVKAKAVGR